MRNLGFTRFQARVRSKGRLYAPEEQENHEDQHNETQTAAGVVAPTTAIRPSRQRPECYQKQDHNQNGQHDLCRPNLPFQENLGLSTLRPRIKRRSAGLNNQCIHVAVNGHCGIFCGFEKS